MRVWVSGVGVVGPGLDGWAEARAVLTGKTSYERRATAYAALDGVSAAERRRMGVPIKLALQAGFEAVAGAQCPPESVATVFASSGGDGENVHQLCETLASAEREVSPTRFHNAVHNAAAGYWSIATRAQVESTSLCCHDASFAAGLLEAVTQVQAGGSSVALIAYDHRYPHPLDAVRPIGGDLGAALVLSPERGPTALACLEVHLVRGPRVATAMRDAALERLRTSIPAARSLPLLAAIARARADEVVLDYLGDLRLRVQVVAA